MISHTEIPLARDISASSEALPHEWRLRVYVQDTDMGGVVYHSRYLDFAERARAELLRAQGLSLTLLAGESEAMPQNLDYQARPPQDIKAQTVTQPVTIVVSSLEASYHKPARLDDLLAVRTSLIKASKARFQLLQNIVRLDNLTGHEDAALCASLKVTLACVTKICAEPLKKGVTGTRDAFKAVRPPDCLCAAMFAYYLEEK